MSARGSRTVLLAGILAAACGDEPAPAGAGPCQVRLLAEAPRPGRHVAAGSPIEFATNPPMSGTHFDVWAAWDRAYDPPLARGYWLHNAEHGGVVFLYNCPGGCDDQVAALRALIAGLPDDPRCAAPVRHRVLLTADPELPPEVRVAAVAWGGAHTAVCVDEAAMRAFHDAHAAQTAENICTQGLLLPGTSLVEASAAAPLPARRTD
jgi:hypothetical protein